MICVVVKWTWIKNKICNNHTPSTRPAFCGSGPSPTPPSPTPPTPTPPTSSGTLVIEVKTDSFGSDDNWWRLRKRNSLGQFKVARKRFSFYDNRIHKNTYTFPSSSCFIFTMYDNYRDGLCCQHGNGYYQITWNGKYRSLLKISPL